MSNVPTFKQLKCIQIIVSVKMILMVTKIKDIEPDIQKEIIFLSIGTLYEFKLKIE